MQFFSLSLLNMYAQLDLTAVDGENADNAGKMVYSHVILSTLRLSSAFRHNSH